MSTVFQLAIPVLPAVDVAESLRWWTTVCGFDEVFRSGDPASYAGLARDAVRVHFAKDDGAAFARKVGAQTMVRIAVASLDHLYESFRANGGVVHPNGGLRDEPWGGRAFSAIDPAGVCVTFTED